MEAIRLAGTIEMPPKGMSMHPGKGHHQAVLRWTSPQAGLVTATGSLLGYSLIGGTPQTVMSVFAGSDKLLSVVLNIDGKPNQEVFQFRRQVKAGEACAVVESVKTASDIYSPVTGEITAVNAAVVGVMRAV